MRTARAPSPLARAPAAAVAPTPTVRSSGYGDPVRYGLGVEVAIGPFRFRCCSVLGRGSFSEVWSGEVLGSAERLEVALKDIMCVTASDMQQAMLEVSILERFQGLSNLVPGKAAPAMRIPRYFAHRVDQRASGWRVRMAMGRLPGESLEAFLSRPPPPGQDGPSSIRRGCGLAAQLLRQLGPTLDRVSAHAWHRDVNSHNILVSDIFEGGRLKICQDPEETTSRASFWLVDFGLAVDSTTWPTVWPHSDVAGDCRYWPPSSFLMSFYGADEMVMHKDFCNQYKTRLDIVGLGLTAIEILCSTALSSSFTWGKDGPLGPWQRLCLGWERYHKDVSRWHNLIFQVFSAGGDIAPLYQQLAKEHVVEKVTKHIARLGDLLRGCIPSAEDSLIRSLVAILAEMIDEKSQLDLREAVERLGGDAGATRSLARHPVHKAPLKKLAPPLRARPHLIGGA